MIATKSDFISSSSREPHQHLLLPARSRAACTTKRDLVREPADLQQPFSVDRPGSFAALVQDPDDRVARPQRDDRFRRVLPQARPCQLAVQRRTARSRR